MKLRKLNWKIILNSFTALLFLLLMTKVDDASANQEPSVLMIYSIDSLNPTQEVYDLQNWLSHFSPRVNVKRDMEVNAQDLENVTHIVYLDQSEKELSLEVKTLIDSFDGKKLVFGDHAKNLKDFHFMRFTEKEKRINRITLQNNEQIMLPEFIPMNVVVNNQSSERLMDGLRGEEMISSLAVKQHNSYYVNINQFKQESIQQLMIELLHQFIDSNHSNKKEVLIVIDQINPTTSAKNLESLIQLLQNEGSSYMLAVSPVFKNKDIDSKMHLKGNKDLIDILKERNNQNGYILLKQQLEDVQYEKGVQELASHQIYPIGVYGSNPISDEINDMIHVENYVSGKTLIPQSENVGIRIPIFGRYQSPNESQINFQRLKKRLQDLSTYSDRVICITFPAYLKKEELQLFIQTIDDLENAEWFNLSKVEAKVEVPYVSINLQDGILTGEENLPFFNQWLLTLSLSKVEIVLWVIALLVAFSIGCFMLYIILLRVQLRKRLFNERKLTSNG